MPVRIITKNLPVQLGNFCVVFFFEYNFFRSFSTLLFFFDTFFPFFKTDDDNYPNIIDTLNWSTLHNEVEWFEFRQMLHAWLIN